LIRRPGVQRKKKSRNPKPGGKGLKEVKHTPWTAPCINVLVLQDRNGWGDMSKGKNRGAGSKYGLHSDSWERGIKALPKGGKNQGACQICGKCNGALKETGFN